MKIIYFITLILFLNSCSSSKTVYWCGDHPCLNKKEKEDYFKKTMIVEVRETKTNSRKKNSEIQKLMNQAKDNEKKNKINNKKLKKNEKIVKKRKIEEEKELLKQSKINKKKRIIEEKKLAKQAKIEDELRREAILEEEELKKQAILNKKIKTQNDNVKEPESNNLKTTIVKEIKNDKLNKFDSLVENIFKENSVKDYPDINKIPN